MLDEIEGHEQPDESFSGIKMRMDLFYRQERHKYDRSRRFYLWGRDTLIEKLEIPDGGALLEVGCGTARNLIKLAKRNPVVRLYGLDASSLMLKTAETNLRHQNLESRITLKLGVAESWNHETDFGLQKPFDAIVFSYSLSMIEDWKDAIETALRNLRPGGRIYVVDFGDQAGMPAWYRGLSNVWFGYLSRHHAYNRLFEIPGHFRQLEKAGRGQARIIDVGRGHATCVIFAPIPAPAYPDPLHP